MAWTTDFIRNLVNALAASSQERSDVTLTSESVDLILAALRAYRGASYARLAEEPLDGFQIEAVDDFDLPREVLATTPDENIAQTMLTEAKRRFPGRKIVLRGATISKKIVAPVVTRGHYSKRRA
jgi:hypothetical protein